MRSKQNTRKHNYIILLTVNSRSRPGFTPHFRNIPWARALHLVEFGQLDVAMAALPLPERQRYARFSAPYRQSAYVLLSNDPIPGHRDPWEGIDSLEALCQVKGLKLGKLRGTRPIEQIKHCPSLKATAEFNTDDRLIDLLLARRLDGIIMEWQNARHRLTELGADTFISCQLLLHHQPVSLMFAKHSVSEAQLISINHAISTLPILDDPFSTPDCHLTTDPQAAALLTRTNR